MSTPPDQRELRISPFWGLQLAVWGLCFAAIAAGTLPFLEQRGFVAFRVTLALGCFLCSFPLYLFCRRMVERRVPVGRAFLLAALAAYLFGFLCAAGAEWAEARFALPPGSGAFRWTSALGSTVGAWSILFASVTIYLGFDYYRDFQEQRKWTLAAVAEARDAQLEALRYQLHPHFLFNALNAISTLVYDGEAEAANRMLDRLATFLRGSLEAGAAHEVELGVELDLTRQYLEIEQIRFGERLQLRIDVEPEAMAARVPRLLLQPLVENAVRHGLARIAGPGELAIRVGRRAAQLEVEIRNDGPAVDPAALADGDGGQARGGAGLRNVRRRLHALHPNDHRLVLQARPEGGCALFLTFPFRLQEEPA